ncbi:hypothetical protein DIZ81_13800 [Legionella taurinensis]|uniref:Uncharacterized protein n=1 Tax=Legionella taurinensis TaxID=70611 RepID=A0AB38N0Q7_9GAMM|nr:hypothetical protein [Legionella taurinensis]MDX1838805.1 hypothetical protein [Legionella taurinensis]PUT38603.1 hypothetical protein DB744_13810 [Legionella taurinensis]PUT39512.1 hypothetical protein DB746_13820 [Legionella taurinensis]PUT41610.1 hypothetical protein DB743_13860 [Legionella taurinensis]PUT45015.1 hypothetical protein DB745_13760 [Legionella taurinensis]
MLLQRVLERISELEKIRQVLKEEKKILDAHRAHLLAGVSPVSLTAFEAYRQQQLIFIKRESALEQEYASLQIMAQVLNPSPPAFERLIIGAGVAGTLLFQEFSPAFRSQNAARPDLPNILVLNDPNNLNTWPKEGSRVMGQPARVQTPTGFSYHSTDFDLKNGEDPTNPYNYVLANDFHRALVATQVDLEMPILQAEAKAIEKREEHTDRWVCGDYEYRLRVLCKFEEKTEEVCLYTHYVDICAGLGSSRKLTDSQIAPALAEKLVKTQTLIYAQDGDVNLEGEVLLYGGSAINAAWATELLERSEEKDNVKIKKLVSRNRKGLDDISTLSRFISEACENRLELAVGELANVRELDDGRLAVSFKARESGPYEGLKEDEEIICDKLVVAIGQVNPGITDGLSQFKQCIYKTHLDTPPIPLGTYSQDHRIFVWGAAGTLGIGLASGERERFVKQIQDHANSFPYESMALGGIFRVSWVIPQMCRHLGKLGLFPMTPGYDSRRLLCPDINQATIEDLEALIASDNPVIRRKGAEEIIKLRCAVMPNHNKDAPGIQSMAQLQTILPPELLVHIRRVYFPFAPEAGLPKPTTGKIKLSGNRHGLFTPPIPPVDEFDESISQLNALMDESDIQLPVIDLPRAPDGEKEIETLIDILDQSQRVFS